MLSITELTAAADLALALATKMFKIRIIQCQPVVVSNRMSRMNWVAFKKRLI